MDADTIKVIAVAFIMIGMGIAQLLGKAKQQSKAKDSQRPQGPKPDQAKAWEDEIGQFLQTAKQKQQRLKQQRRTAKPVAQAEVVDQRLASAKMERREEHLADEVTQADEKMDEHLHNVFDHRVGQLASTQREADSAAAAMEPSPTIADNLFALLSTPQNIRQAIIINEILQRPE